MQGVAIGRIVHYVMINGKYRPGIVVEVHNDQGCINLQVFTDGNVMESRFGILWCSSVSYSEKAEPGTWHWPEKG